VCLGYVLSLIVLVKMGCFVVEGIYEKLFYINECIYCMFEIVLSLVNMSHGPVTLQINLSFKCGMILFCFKIIIQNIHTQFMDLIFIV